MAIETPPEITPVPTPAIQRGDRVTFSSRVDAFVIWLVAAVAQFGAVAANAYHNASEAMGSAVAAAADRVQTGLDRVQTGADRVQTGQDRAAAAASAATIGTTAAFSDVNPIVKNAADQTKVFRLNLAGLAPGQDLVCTPPLVAGQLATIADAAALSGMVMLAPAYTPGAVAMIDFAAIITAQYDDYSIYIDGIRTSTDSDILHMRVFVGGVISLTNQCATASDAGAGPIASPQIALTASGVGIGAGVTARIDIFNANDPTQAKMFFINEAHVYGTNLYANSKKGAFVGGAISGIRLQWAFGTFIAGGKIRIYGFKKTQA